MNKVVPASVLRIVRAPDEHKNTNFRENASRTAIDIGCQPKKDLLVILRRSFLKHMALCNTYSYLPDLPENAEFDSDAEADEAEDLRKASFYLQPSTIPGILAALEWFREDFEHFHINDKPNPEWADRWGLKMLEGSIKALQQIAAKNAA